MINRQQLRNHILALQKGDNALKRQTFQALRDQGEGGWADAPDDDALSLVEALRVQLCGEPKGQHYQREAATVLGNMGARSGPAVPQLVELLGEGVPDAVREAAATALGQIGKPASAAAGPLVKLLASSRPALSARAVRALGHIGCADAAVRSALVGLWLAPQQFEGSKVQAAIALCRLGIGAPNLLETLAKALVASPEVPLRKAAAEALAWCGPADPGVVPALLLAVLSDKHDGVRAAAQAGLDRMTLTPEKAVVPCAGQLGASPYAEAALRKSGLKAVPALVKALAAGRPGIRAAASRALGGIGTAAGEAAPALAEALGDADPEVRLAAAKGLWDVTNVADQAVPALIKLLKARAAAPGIGDERRKFLQTVMEALGRIGPPAAGAVPALTAMTKDGNRHVRETALAALQKIGTR
jgi:HEAT repeat protein